MKRTMLLCTLAAAVAAGAFTATRLFAAGTADAPPARGHFLQRVADKLHLTGDQRTQIKAVLAGEKNTLTPLLATLHESRKNLHAAIRADDANESSVRAASAQVAAAEADLAVERMKLHGKIAPVLTDAQRQQLAGLQQRADDFVDGMITRLGSGLGD